MKNYSLIGMIFALILLALHVPESNAWTWWCAQTLNINYDRAIYINNGCSADQQTRINNACKAWFWTGAKYRPYIVSTTTRAAGTQDNVNVIGNDNGTNTWLGLTSFWNNDADECDIRMNTGRYSWHVGTHWTMPSTPTQYTYQGVATHEIGHLMGLGHSSENSGETNAILRNATMFYTCNNNSSRTATLGRDDNCGIHSRVGHRAGQWQIVHNPGYDVRLPINDNEVQLYIDPKGQGTDWGDWVIIRKENLGGWVDSDTRIEWEEYDRGHSAIINPYIVGVDGVGRELYYAKNAPNWYTNGAHIGWPDLSSYPESYNQWVCVAKSIWNDYRAEYGVDPAYVLEVKIRHFVNTSWQGDHGCNVRNVHIRGIEPY